MNLLSTLLLIATLHSNAGETRDAFVMRVAPQAVAYTLAHGVETCGVIGERDGEYTLRLRTINANAECSMAKSDVEDGYTFSGVTFHTHPTISPPRFKGADYSVPGYVATYRGVAFQQGQGTDKFVGRFPERQMATLLP